MFIQYFFIKFWLIKVTVAPESTKAQTENILEIPVVSRVIERYLVVGANRDGQVDVFDSSMFLGLYSSTSSIANLLTSS